MLDGYKTYISIISALAYCAYGVWSGNLDYNTAATIIFPMLGIGGVRSKMGRDE